MVGSFKFSKFENLVYPFHVLALEYMPEIGDRSSDSIGDDNIKPSELGN